MHLKEISPCFLTQFSGTCLRLAFRFFILVFWFFQEFLEIWWLQFFFSSFKMSLAYSKEKNVEIMMPSHFQTFNFYAPKTVNIAKKAFGNPIRITEFVMIVRKLFLSSRYDYVLCPFGKKETWNVICNVCCFFL